MTENTDTTTTEKPTRARARKVRIEEHPDVVLWCDNFVKWMEGEHGYTPTPDQAINAFLVAALKALGASARRAQEAD